MKCRLYHATEVVTYLLTTASRQQGYDRKTREAILLCKRTEVGRVMAEEGTHLVERRVAHVVDGVVVLPLEELHLEGQYGIEEVDIPPDGLDAVLLPRPYLGRDVVV